MPLAKFSRDPQKNVTVAYTKNKETDTVADPQRGEEWNPTGIQQSFVRETSLQYEIL